MDNKQYEIQRFMHASGMSFRFSAKMFKKSTRTLEDWVELYAAEIENLAVWYPSSVLRLKNIRFCLNECPPSAIISPKAPFVAPVDL